MSVRQGGYRVKGSGCPQIQRAIDSMALSRFRVIRTDQVPLVSLVLVGESIGFTKHFENFVSPCDVGSAMASRWKLIARHVPSGRSAIASPADQPTDHLPTVFLQLACRLAEDRERNVDIAGQQLAGDLIAPRRVTHRPAPGHTPRCRKAPEPVASGAVALHRRGQRERENSALGVPYSVTTSRARWSVETTAGTESTRANTGDSFGASSSITRTSIFPSCETSPLRHAPQHRASSPTSGKSEAVT